LWRGCYADEDYKDQQHKRDMGSFSRKQRGATMPNKEPKAVVNNGIGDCKSPE